MVGPQAGDPQDAALSDPERIAALDVLRGIAVMGILLMNIVAFALPEGAYINPAAADGGGAADYATWTVAALLVDGRMRALFTMLFGASMLLAAARARDAGEDAGRRHLRRMAWLGLIGAAHLYLLWPGDILLHYALVGAVAWGFAERPAAGLARAALLCLAVQLLIDAAAVANLAMLRDAATGARAPADAVALWRATEGAIGVATPDALAAEGALHQGGWWAAARHRLTNETALPLELLLFNGAETLGLMLLGMAGLRSGFLTGGWSRAGYVRAAAAAYAMGLPLGGLLLLADVRSGFDSLTVFTGWLAGMLPLRALIACGHAAVALLWLGGGSGALRRRIAATGRIALSNYLASSLALAALFEGWGLGLFGRLGRSELALLAAPLWAAMLLWSPAWLARHHLGPVEWLWRSAVSGQLLAMRKPIARQSQ